MFNQKTPYRLLRDWAMHAERYWYPLANGMGCYGTGYEGWGVQTNQKYCSAMAVLAMAEPTLAAQLEIPREFCLERALAALRFSLTSHKAGAGTCTDGRQWGHTWISALGQERMLGAVWQMREHLTEADVSNLRKVLTSEAGWLLRDYQRGPTRGITAGRWGNSGHNDPESNGWNGAFLWRVACLYPDHPDAQAWRERSRTFLLNTISMEEDALCERIVDGVAVKDAHIAANFFPGYSLDHHAYFNVGYMVITASGAAMSHFDLKAMGAPRPKALDWHQKDHWQVLRRLIFSDGRLARLGGDSRVRYAYCQEYLLPTLLYAAECLGEENSGELIEKILDMVVKEADWSQDGSFYGRRLKPLAESSPYYYTRLESDRACALSQLALYSAQLSAPLQEPARRFEATVRGGWDDVEYGNVMHRSETRLASFSWRAYGLAQGMCLPPHRSDMAEWQGNLVPRLIFMGQEGQGGGLWGNSRKLVGYKVSPFEGGFLTWGTVAEGLDVTVPEGWKSAEQARTQVVFAALPDGHTTIGFHYVKANEARVYTRELKDLHWCLPNDLYNGFKRQMTTWEGEVELVSPPSGDEQEFLPGNWLHVEGGVGLCILHGAKGFTVHRSAQRRAGQFQSLFVEEICLTCTVGATSHDAHSVMLDSGWCLLSGVNPEETRRFATEQVLNLPGLPAEVRGVRVRDMNRQYFVLLANFGADAVECLVGEKVKLDAWSAVLFRETQHGLEHCTPQEVTGVSV